MSAWIFPYLAAATGGAGGYYDSPWRIVVHTTETKSNPYNWVGGWRSPSHVVCDYENGVIVQCVSLDQAAKSLYNAAGGVETNRLRCIQVEINGRAEEAGNWPDAKLRWLATQVFAPIVAWIRSTGGDINLDPAAVPLPGAIPNSARADAPQRMSWAQWNSHNSLVGHRHVPENDHWDAGLLDMRRLAVYITDALNGTVSNPDQPIGARDMSALLKVDANGTLVATDGVFRKVKQSWPGVQAEINLGVYSKVDINGDPYPQILTETVDLDAFINTVTGQQAQLARAVIDLVNRVAALDTRLSGVIAAMNNLSVGGGQVDVAALTSAIVGEHGRRLVNG